MRLSTQTKDNEEVSGYGYESAASDRQAGSASERR
jgi:hypothetical protein